MNMEFYIGQAVKEQGVTSIDLRFIESQYPANTFFNDSELYLHMDGRVINVKGSDPQISLLPSKMPAFKDLNEFFNYVATQSKSRVQVINYEPEDSKNLEDVISNGTGWGCTDRLKDGKAYRVFCYDPILSPPARPHIK